MGKQLIFWLYHQEMLVNMIFLQVKIFYPKKKTVKKAATNETFEYSLLGKQLKAQTDIAKNQYKLLKDKENNVNDNNREDNNNREEDNSNQSNIINGGSNKLLSVKSRDRR